LQVKRYGDNPIIRRGDIEPSREDFEVIGVFNCGVTRLGEEVVLLLRVAERPVSEVSDSICVAYFDTSSEGYVINSFSKKDSSIDFSDPRLVVTPGGTYLTSISHLRVARSTDGINFKVEENAGLFPSEVYEIYGIEDPRISFIDRLYYICYVGVCPFGVSTCLVSTEDFVSFRRHGVIFCPENKDVVLFPGQAGGRYYALHRPVSPLFGRQDIWIAESLDLICWGNHRRLMLPRAGYWDEVKIGAGAVPVMTESGWLEVYHGVGRDNKYCLGSVLLDAEEPWKVLARSEGPILEPEADYERSGFIGKVVFSCGLLCEDDKLKIYYGAADTSIAYAEAALGQVLSELTV